jgi:hypothetical protein
MHALLIHQTRRFVPWVSLALLASALLQAQNPTPSISLPGSQSPFTGSEPDAKPTPGVLQLSFQEAIDRGLRNNLGLLLASDQTIMARAPKPRASPLSG